MLRIQKRPPIKIGTESHSASLSVVSRSCWRHFLNSDQLPQTSRDEAMKMAPTHRRKTAERATMMSLPMAFPPLGEVADQRAFDQGPTPRFFDGDVAVVGSPDG